MWLHDATELTEAVVVIRVGLIEWYTDGVNDPAGLEAGGSDTNISSGFSLIDSYYTYKPEAAVFDENVSKCIWTDYDAHDDLGVYGDTSDAS